MKSPHETHAELRGIVEALCEERMTADQAQRLEAITREDRSARRYFLEYVELHGNLYWDAAQGDLDSDAVAPALRRPSAIAPARQIETAQASHRFVRQHARTLAATGIVLLALVWLGWRNVSNNRQGAGQAPESGMAAALHGRDRNAPDQNREMQTAERGDLTPAKTVPASLDVTQTAVSKPDLVERPAPTADPADDEHDGTSVVEFINDRVRAAWHKDHIVPPGRSADGEWLRRTSLGIVGHIPAEDVVDAFLADADPQKRSALVDRLLLEADYARAWSAIWTANLVGHGDPAPGVMRDALETHLLRRFSVNAPWNEIVYELIAAEGFADRQPAVNFLLAHRDHGLTSATEAISRLFLGLPAAVHDGGGRFWELHSFLVQTEAILPEPGSKSAVAELISRPVGGPALYETIDGQKRAAFPKFAGHEIDAGAKTNRRRELARLIARSDDPQFARAIVNRMWLHFFGTPLVLSLDASDDKASQRQEILARLSKEFIAANCDLKQLIRWICATDAYQLAAGEEAAFAVILPRPMSPEQLYESLLVAGRAATPQPDRWESASRRRHEWVRRYSLRYPADAPPQAWALMNDPLVLKAIGSGPKPLPAELASLSLGDDAKVRRLCRSTLSREPRAIELAAGGQILAESRRSRAISDSDRLREETQALEDVYWAFLNAREFALVK